MKKIFLTFILIFIATILFGADSTTVLELPELLSPDINDYIIIVDSSGTPATKRISVPLFIGYIEAMVLDTLDVHDMGIDTLNVTSGVGALDVTSIIVDTVAITKATLGTVYDSVYFEQVNTDSFEIGGTAVTSTADELNILDGVTSSADELNYLDISTEGNVEGSKAIIADANKDIDFKGGDITATNITAIGKFDNQWTATAGANVGNMYKTTLTAGETFTGTTGHQFEVYDALQTVVHTGEHCGIYVKMKQLSAMTLGGKSVLYSGHNYGSGGDYQIIDAADWRYGNFVVGYKVSGGSIVTGVDLSETVVTSEELLGSNGENWENITTDGQWTTDGGITAETITSNGQITQETYVIRKVVSQTGMTDNTATSIFTITTTTTEFGGYKCNMSIMAGDDIVNHNENMAVMGVDAHFVRVLENNTNTGTTSAVAEISQTVSANEGTGAVTDITIRVANTSETVQTIQAEVDVSAGGVADIIIIVELIYWDLATAPVIAES